METAFLFLGLGHKKPCRFCLGLVNVLGTLPPRMQPPYCEKPKPLGETRGKSMAWLNSKVAASHVSEPSSSPAPLSGHVTAAPAAACNNIRNAK